MSYTITSECYCEMAHDIDEVVILTGELNWGLVESPSWHGGAVCIKNGEAWLDNFACAPPADAQEIARRLNVEVFGSGYAPR